MGKPMKPKTSEAMPEISIHSVSGVRAIMEAMRENGIALFELNGLKIGRPTSASVLPHAAASGIASPSPADSKAAHEAWKMRMAEEQEERLARQERKRRGQTAAAGGIGTSVAGLTDDVYKEVLKTKPPPTSTTPQS
jgi:hypothetical protein